MNGRSGVPSLTRRGLLALGLGSLGVSSADAAAARRADALRLFVLGDSWAAGLHADPRRALGQTAAQLLGWQAEVDAVSGTGYLVDTDAGPSYPDRLRRSAPVEGRGVAVVQGGSNDGGRPLHDLPPAVTATVRLLRSRRPQHSILLLGPGPDPEPVTAGQRAVDEVLARTAKRLHVPYVSMLREDWIDADHADEVLDPDNDHPTVAGQRYLGRRLARTVRTHFPHLVA